MRLSAVTPFALALSLVSVQVACSRPAESPAESPAATPASAASAPHADGNVNQVMRGILFPASNVVFAAQSTDPETVARASDPSLATDPLASAYGGWEAVLNASMALSESANLLMIPGRVCSNGKPAPIGDAEWSKGVEELRAAGEEAHKGATARNMDAMLDAADKVATACSTCHDVYREKSEEQGGEAARCTK